MLKTKIAGVEIGTDFTFFALIALFIALDTTGFALMSLAVCAIHEAGHLIAVLIKGHKLSSLTFRGGGIKISSCPQQTEYPYKDSFLILIAGSAVNISLFFLLYFTLPKTNITPIMFAVLNLTIGVFNLLPIGCLDGNRILRLFISDKALKTIEIIAITGVVAAIILILLKGGTSGGFNFTIIAAMVYIICVDTFSNTAFSKT
jgi:Zn-dependent protease